MSCQYMYLGSSSCSLYASLMNECNNMGALVMLQPRPESRESEFGLIDKHNNNTIQQWTNTNRTTQSIKQTNTKNHFYRGRQTDDPDTIDDSGLNIPRGRCDQCTIRLTAVRLQILCSRCSRIQLRPLDSRKHSAQGEENNH